MDPAYVLLGLIVTAFLAWSWAEAAEAAEEADDAGPAEGPADGGGGEERVTTIQVWLVRALLVAVEGAVWLVLALLLP
jgi:hypothetical protein